MRLTGLDLTDKDIQVYEKGKVGSNLASPPADIGLGPRLLLLRHF